MAAFHWFSLLLILSTTIFVNAGRSKRSPIVTDELAGPREFPWAVAMENSTRQYFCSGGIIDEKYIISAAHCFINAATYKLKSKYIKVYAGTTNYMEAASENGNHAVKVPVKKVFVPIDYDYYSDRSDIAILELQTGLNIERNNLGKLNLPSEPRRDVIGELAQVAAFGLGQYPARGSEMIEIKALFDGKLRHATVEIVQEAHYRAEIYRHAPEFIFGEGHLLGLMRKQSHEIYGLCKGDSGASLVDNSATVIGVAAKIFDDYCDGRTVPSLFTDVTKYLPFIQRVMRGKSTEDILVHKCDISITGPKGKSTKLMNCLPCLNPKVE